MENILLNRIYRQPIIDSHQLVQKKKVEKENTSFDDLLKKKIGGDNLNFSAHANKRLEERGIKLTQTELQKLNNAVQKVSDKGAKESLIMMNNISFIVNVKNKTVITAMDDRSSKNNVFTNIDSAIRI